MAEPASARILAAVDEHYGLRLTRLTTLPLGQDDLARRYRGETAEGTAWFLKLRQGGMKAATLLVPRHLADRGVVCVVAPVRTGMQALSAALDGWTLALYPFIDGHTAAAHPLREQHWRTYGAAIRAVHDTRLEPALEQLLTPETFESPWAERVRALDARISQPEPGAVAAELAPFWEGRRALIRELVDRLETLGAQLRMQRPPLVLCHADAHLNNVLVDTADRLWIVDWDDVKLGAKECDLFMGLGGIAGARANSPETGWFLEGYGGVAPDPVALAYYRCLRAVEDIGAYGERVALAAAGDAARRSALQRLQSAFAPGGIVSVV